MNIMIVSNESNLYGAGRDLLSLACGLKELHMEVYVVFPEKGPLINKLNGLGISYKVLGMSFNCGKQEKLPEKIFKLTQNINAVMQLCYFVWKWKIDIICSNNARLDVGAEAALLCRKKHVWFIREFTQEDFGLTYDFPKKTHFLMKKAYALVAISEAVKKKYEKLNSRIIKIYDGLEKSLYLKTNEDFLMRSKVNFLICGGIVQNIKGQAEAIEAVRILVNRGIDGIKLHILGGGDPTTISYLKRYVQENQLNKYISFLGFQEDTQSIRRNMDISLVCSRMEAYGRVTVESMLAEVLVIGNEKGGTGELIGDNERGLLYKQGNAEDLADKMEYAMTHRMEMIGKIRKAKEFALKNCTTEHMMRRVGGLLNKCGDAYD